MKSYLIIAILLTSCLPKSQTLPPWENYLSVEQNIAKNAIILENIEDMSFLDDVIRNRSVIILGEESHFDYSTIEIKIKMIDYLQNKGFNTIVVEGAPLLTSYVFSNPRYAEITKNWKIEWFWRLNDLRNERFRPFLENIQEQT